MILIAIKTLRLVAVGWVLFLGRCVLVLVLVLFFLFFLILHFINIFCYRCILHFYQILHFVVYHGLHLKKKIIINK